MRPVDILAFSPHPDDAEIGCGGLLLLAGQRGLRTAVVDLSEGELATRGSREERAAERREATRLLGLSSRESLGLPDTRIRDCDEQIGPVVECLRRLRPRLVLAPWVEDRHPDHAAAGLLIRRALFLASVRRVGAGLPHRTGRLLHYMVHSPFPPGLIVDIGPVWELLGKVRACYPSQFGASTGGVPGTALSDGSFLQALDARAIHFGAMIRAARGEPYLCPEPLGISSPEVLLDGLESKAGYGMFR